MALTDAQKKKIIADRIEGLSFRKIAAKNHVSEYAVRTAVKNAEQQEFAQKIAQKKQENTEDIITQLDARKDKVIEIIDLGFEALINPEKFDRAGAQAIATTIGILIDKYTNLAQLMNSNGGSNNQLLQSLHELETRRRDNGD